MTASSDVLRRAAEKLDQLAAETTGHRWEAVENYPGMWVVAPAWVEPPTKKGVRNPPRPHGYVASESNTGDIAEPDVRWMVTCGPQVAAPLAAWLRGHADYIAAVQCSADSDALALARAILGESS